MSSRSPIPISPAPAPGPTALPEQVVESVDMGDWEDTSVAAAPLAVAAPLPVAAQSDPEPVQALGEDDFSSLNSDTEPRAAAPSVEENLGPTQTLDIPATDISVLDASGQLPSSEVLFAEEPVQPVSEEWDSAPLAVEDTGTAAPPPPTYDSWEDASVPRAFDAGASPDADPIAVTASHPLP